MDTPPETGAPEACAFAFYESVNLIRLTGLRAKTLDELVTLLGEVDHEVIFHHMHQYFLKERAEAPEYPNDFALWAAESLEDRVLAERLANVDPFEYDSLEDLRDALITIIDDHLDEQAYPRAVLPGKEFFLNKTFSIVMPTGRWALTLRQFRDHLAEVDDSSIYYHVLESRLRLHQRADDFSRWLEDCLGLSKLAERIRRIDPYFSTLEDVRREILAIIDQFLEQSMERET
jgi:hypothetical protein